MNEQQFLEIAQQTRLSAVNREAARLHFVVGMMKVDAAAEAGISKQRMSQIVKVIESAQERGAEVDKLAPAGRSSEATGLNYVLAVNASYAVAVKSARDLFGDDTNIQSPAAKGASLGDVVGRTDFHLVQSNGRGTVTIHELAKLDRVPAQGKTVMIEYAGGRAVVSERGRESNRGLTR